MAYVIFNNVRMSVSGTPGTGSVTVGTATTLFQSFASAGAANGDTFPYRLEDGSTGAWEIGIGTYSTTGPSVTRTTITASSNAGAAISATSAAIIMCAALSADYPVTSFIPVGTAMLFAQTTAPTGWTKVITYNDYALRVVSGTAGTGGSVAFTTAFASKTVSGTVTMTNAAVTLTTATIPSHNHTANAYEWNLGAPAGTGTLYYSRNSNATNGSQSIVPGIGNTGSDGSHTHANTASFSGTSINLAVQYVDVIIATKN